MARSTMRIKVRVDVLLTNAEKQRAKLVADHAKATAKYEEAVRLYKGDVIDALEAAISRAFSGKLPETTTRYSGGRSSEAIVLPLKSRPSKPTLNTSRIDRDIAFLKAAADETLAICADDNFGQYL